jgi:hypothetical protein
MKLEKSNAAAVATVPRPGGSRARPGGRRYVGRAEDEPRHDDHRTEKKGEAQERQEHPLVRREPAKVHPDEAPQDGQRKDQPHRRQVEAARRLGSPRREGHVTDERGEQIAHHPDGDAQREPLREAGDEAQVRAQAAAGVDVAAAGPGHGRGEDGVGQAGENGRDRGEQVRQQTPEPMPGTWRWIMNGTT